MLLETNIMSPQKPAVGTVIWMHGLGANNHDFDDIVPDFWSNDQLPLKFIFPNAPLRPVHINMQTPTRAWYDVYSLTDLNCEDKTGIHASQAAIDALIQQEINHGVPANRIVLAGFSQGGAMALYTGMRQKSTLAGILALSCYLPLLHEHADTVNAHNAATPIFMVHGTEDMTLPYFVGKMSYDMIRKTHPNIQWKEYRMSHEIKSSEIQDIGVWFKSIF